MLTCPLFNQSRNGVQLCNISLSCSLKTKLDGLSITFQVPTGETLTLGDDSFMSFEETGVKEVQKAACRAGIKPCVFRQNPAEVDR